MQITCARCGYPLREMTDEETTEFLRVGGSAVAAHAPGQCPTEQGASAPGPRLRSFTARLVVEEVVDDDAGASLITEFTARAQAPSAAAVMAPGGPLATAFGDKWSTVAEHVGFADVGQ